jgi:hypothetical protein
MYIHSAMTTIQWGICPRDSFFIAEIEPDETICGP